jgi:hypothetical protein
MPQTLSDHLGFTEIDPFCPKEMSGAQPSIANQVMAESEKGGKPTEKEFTVGPNRCSLDKNQRYDRTMR